MADEAPKVVKQESRRKEGVLLPPADFRAVAPWLIIGGLALSIAGWVDALLFWWPLHLGNEDWEVGTIGQTVDALPLGTLALLLTAIGIRAVGGRRIWSRLMAVLFLLLGLFLLAQVVIFLLDMPYLVRAWNSPGGTGIKRAVAKVTLFGTVYFLTYTALGISMWRAASRRKAAEVAAKPAAAKTP